MSNPHILSAEEILSSHRPQTVHVTNISRSTSKSSLRSFFYNCGIILQIRYDGDVMNDQKEDGDDASNSSNSTGYVFFV